MNEECPKGMSIPSLETNRLLLRPPALADADVFQWHFADWEVIKQIGSHVPWPYPTDGARKYLEIFIPQNGNGSFFYWGIFSKKNPQELIGAIEYRFRPEDEENRGFWLSQSFWGQGLMTEAVARTQDYMFFDVGVSKLIIRNLSSNARSRNIKEKTGALLIGQGTGEYHDGIQDEDIWELTKARWIQARKGLGSHEVLR